MHWNIHNFLVKKTQKQSKHHDGHICDSEPKKVITLGDKMTLVQNASNILKIKCFKTPCQWINMKRDVTR